VALNNAVLTWNANTEPDLAGYRVYFGQQSGLYTSTQALGIVTTTTLLNTAFNNDGTWRFAISAFDTSNNESALSTIVTKRIVRTASKLTVRR
jgi:hypothetical protein